MKLLSLYESYDLNDDEKKEIMQNDIIHWCRVNLSNFYNIRDFEIDDDFVIHSPIMHVVTKIKTFLYKSTDVEFVYINNTDALENFNNFPTSGSASDISYSFINLDGNSKKSGVDFSKLPVSEDVDSVKFTFDKIDYVTTDMICDLHHNIETIKFIRCKHPDLYDFAKYKLYTHDYYISASTRFKNFGDFLREEISYSTFEILNTGQADYTFEDIDFLNNLFKKYKEKYDHGMDFVLELIDNGFEDEV